MSSDRKPVLKVTFKRGEQNYSVISVWKGKFPGTYSVNRDKGTDKYPPISILDVLKAFAAGDGFVNVSIESEREQRGGGQQRQQRRDEPPDDFGGGDSFGDDEIPF